MQFWIECPPEPKELLLVWQAPSEFPDRLRWAVGRLRYYGSVLGFAYLEGDEFRALNLGRSETDLASANFSGYPAFDRMRRPEIGYWDNALPTFLRRVPSRGRKDFDAYLEHHRVHSAAPLSPLALLAVTEAHLPSDGFSLIDPLDAAAKSVDFTFEIAGFRHRIVSCPRLREGDQLELVPEPSNKWDGSAVQVLFCGSCVGYVNRLQAATIFRWLDAREVHCFVARLNGSQKSPRAYAFARVRPLLGALAA